MTDIPQTEASLAFMRALETEEVDMEALPRTLASIESEAAQKAVSAPINAKTLRAAMIQHWRGHITHDCDGGCAPGLASIYGEMINGD